MYRVLSLYMSLEQSPPPTTQYIAHTVTESVVHWSHDHIHLDRKKAILASSVAGSFLVGFVIVRLLAPALLGNPPPPRINPLDFPRLQEVAARPSPTPTLDPDRLISTITIGNKPFYLANLSLKHPQELEFYTHDATGKKNIHIYKSDREKLLKFVSYSRAEATGGATMGPNINKWYSLHAENTLVKDVSFFGSTHQLAPPTDSGIYYVELTNDDPDPDILASAYLSINTVGAIAKQDDRYLIASLFDLETGEQIQGSYEFSIYNLQDQPDIIVQKNATEIAQTYVYFDMRADMVVFTVLGEDIFVPLETYLSEATIRSDTDYFKHYTAYIHLDRPVYQPGDKLKFSGIIRKDDDALYAPTGGSVTFDLYYGDPQNPQRIPLASTSEGTFSGEVTLDSKAVGTQLLRLSVAPSSGYTISAHPIQYQVVSYIQPPHDLSVRAEKSSGYATDEYVFNLASQTPDKKPNANTPVQYNVYMQPLPEVERAASYPYAHLDGDRRYSRLPLTSIYGVLVGTGEAKLDGLGKAKVPWHLTTYPDRDYEQLYSMMSRVYTFVAQYQDGNELVSAVERVTGYVSDGSIFIRPAASRILAGSPYTVEVYLEKRGQGAYDGREVRAELRLVGQTAAAPFRVITQKTDSRGIAKFTFAPQELREGKKQIVTFAAKDEAERPIIASTELEVITAAQGATMSDSLPYLAIQADKSHTSTDTTLSLWIHAPDKVDALLTLERGRIYSQRVVSLQQGANEVKVPITSDHAPDVEVALAFFKAGRLYRQSIPLEVPAQHKVLTVDASFDKTTYRPSDTAKLTVKLKDSKGNPVQGWVFGSILDAGSLAKYPWTAQPVHSTLYTSRPAKTNVGASLQGILPQEATAAAHLSKHESIGDPTNDISRRLYWLVPTKTAPDGTLTVNIPLDGQELTWSSLIYAVTTEQTQVGEHQVSFTVANQ